MTKAAFVNFFLAKLSSFIDWCCYYTQVSYTGSWEPLVVVHIYMYFLVCSAFRMYYHYTIYSKTCITRTKKSGLLKEGKFIKKNLTTRKGWPFNTGDCLIEVTLWLGLTIIYVDLWFKFVSGNYHSVVHVETYLVCSCT